VGYVLVVVGVVACTGETSGPSSLESEDRDDASLDGSVTPGPDPGGEDAASEPETTASLDAADAATSNDAPSPSDADGGETGDASAQGFFGSPRCGSANVLFCEDFEGQATGAAPDPAKWSVSVTSGNKVAIDGSRAARGSKAAKLTVSTANAYTRAMIVERATFPALANGFFGRMFVFVPRAPQSDKDFLHWTNIEGYGPLSGSVRAKVRYGGQYQNLMANYDTEGASTDWWQHSGVKMPVGRWACFEWQFKKTSKPEESEMRFWLDEVELPKMHVLGRSTLGCCKDAIWAAPTYERLSLGWEHYQKETSGKDYEMWIDEVAVDGARIGCSR
jgi:hypothetical protein